MAVSITLVLSSLAQASEITIEQPKPVPVVGPLLQPFHMERRMVPPAKVTNTPRLESLVRGGNLYLSVQDVIALVLGTLLMALPMARMFGRLHGGNSPGETREVR